MFKTILAIFIVVIVLIAVVQMVAYIVKECLKLSNHS